MGNVVAVVDPMGNVTSSSYDPADQVTSVTDAASSTVAATTTYLYNKNGYEKQVTNPDGESTSYAYADPAYPRLATTLTDPLGRTTTYSYDPDGQISGVTEPSGWSLSYAYNAAGELCWKASVAVSSPSCSSPPTDPTTSGLVTYSYSPAGQVTQVTDATGTTSYLYNDTGELTSTTDGAGNTVSYGYDPAGNITCIAYPVIQGSSCSSAPSPSNTVVDYGYNPASEMTSMTDWLGNTTSYTYDANGNLTTVSYPTSTDVSSYFSFDNANNYQSVLAMDGSFGGGVNWSVGDAWDSNASSLFTSNSVTLGGPDLSGVSSPPASSFTYNQANQMTSGPAVSSYGYSPGSEITSVTPSGASSPSAYLSYDAAGELCSSSTLTPTASTAAACGLSSTPVYESGATSTYGYNQDGERTCATPANSIGASCASPDPAYGSTYGYNPYMEMTCVTPANTSGVTCGDPTTATSYGYTYNAGGLRMSETSPGGTTQQFTWNTHSFVPQLLMDGSNAYIYGPQTSSLGNAPVEQISLSAPNSQSSASYLLSDPEGVRLTFNSSGVITAYASYDAYGNVIGGGLSSVTPFGYAGGYTDPTGLIYLVNRYYDPSTGQFLSVDPLVGVTDQPYQYVGGDPVNGSDPLGLCNIFGNCWSEAAHAVTHVAHDVGHFVQHHWRGIVTGVGIAAGVLALATGVGALADVGILGLSASMTEEISIGASLVSGASDLPACIAGNDMSCVGAAGGFLSAGLGGEALFLGDASEAFTSGEELSVGDLIPGLLGSLSFAMGTGSTFLDILNGLSGWSNPSCG